MFTEITSTLRDRSLFIPLKYICLDKIYLKYSGEGKESTSDFAIFICDRKYIFSADLSSKEYILFSAKLAKYFPDPQLLVLHAALNLIERDS